MTTNTKAGAGRVLALIMDGNELLSTRQLDADEVDAFERGHQEATDGTFTILYVPFPVIAAAPELLEALQLIMNAEFGGVFHASVPLPSGLEATYWGKARSAIAKATKGAND